MGAVPAIEVESRLCYGTRASSECATGTSAGLVSRSSSLAVPWRVLAQHTLELIPGDFCVFKRKKKVSCLSFLRKGYMPTSASPPLPKRSTISHLACQRNIERNFAN